MSNGKVGSGDDEVSEFGKGVYGGRHADKDGKGKGNREGKRLKQEVEHGKGRHGKGGRRIIDGVGVRGVRNDVILRSMCTLRSICALHGRMTPYQRDAVLGTTLQPVLEYGEMAMKRHLMLALIKSWDRRRKAFRIAGREVRFMVFDVVMFTSLPGTGMKVELDGEEVSTEVGNMVRARMGEWEWVEMTRSVSKKFRKERRFFKNYVNVMMELCEENAEEDRVGIRLRLYAFIVLSGVFFPRTPYGAAWSLLYYVDDVDGMGQYVWAEAIWQVVVESIEDTQRKLACGPLSEVQLNGLCLLIQVWFYEHTTRFSDQDGKRFPRIASWRKVDHGDMYDATELLAELEESELSFEHTWTQMSTAFMWRMESLDEWLRRAKEVHALEKEANRRICAEFALMKDRLLQLEERLQEFSAWNGDAGQGAEAVGGATFSGATVTEGTGKPSGLGGAATQDPSSPPNNVNVNLSANTEVQRTYNEDVPQEVNSGNRHNATIFAEEADMQSEAAVQAANENYEQSAAEMAAKDANSVPPTTDSVPVSDGDAGMGEEPSIAGDGGHCVAEMGTSTTTHAGDDQSYPRSSNIVSRMKKVPHLQKPSRVRGLPYTNPMRGTKGGRKGLKSTATGIWPSQSINHAWDVVNDEDVISVVPITVVPAEGEVDDHAVPDAALKDDVPDTSTFSPSSHVPAPRTRGIGSKFVICEEGVKAYLTWTLSPAELDLLAAVRAWCKGLKDDQWNFDMPEASEKHVNVEFPKGLINVVPTRGATDRPGRYCIVSFTVHQYCKLLDFRQCEHKSYRRLSVFLDRHDQLSTVNGGYVTLLQGLLSKPKHAARDIWETLKAQKDFNLCYMLTTDGSLCTTPYNANGTVPENIYYLVGSVTHLPLIITLTCILL
ncbi:LOW QUALITY PROTEIN: hypothetical protein Cgig2_000280 [Carnegiea gigantea]|uniref:Aminotransferase-like plant mobile domain-containing protein n=1 Tax=Carnegiea gigantea TaxID=171969 RepID=A0A9Q1JTE6_9CARY|nr:LOW QUALITY PROTEIN: hypothetical protein Cgig2_000280 [Carnegiea gigantea]